MRTFACATLLCLSASLAVAQETRVVPSPKGDVTVPVDPQRIVVTDGDSILQPALALGLEPVGASRPNGPGGYSQVVQDLLPADAAYIGDTAEPNYEEVLMLEPDLILMSDDDLPDEDGMYRRYTDIAPTVIVHQEQTQWKQALLDVAHITGREAEAQALLDRYQARVAEVGARIGDKAGTATVARIRADHVRYMAQDSSFVWDVMKELGFRAPDTQEKTSATAFHKISLERLDILDADFILVLEDDSAMGPGAMAAQVEALPMYRDLKGEKLVLSSAEYLFGNVLTAFELLDLLEAHFAA